MGGLESKESEVTGQANTNVLVEQNGNTIETVDVFHSVVLILLLGILKLQCRYVGLKQYQRRMKKKYLERATPRPRV